MKTRAAVAYRAGAPLVIETVDLDGPKAGEVLVEIRATGVCHTDAYTLSGSDPEGAFPTILGHEGGGVVEEVGPEVKSVKVGDHIEVVLEYMENGHGETQLSREKAQRAKAWDELDKAHEAQSIVKGVMAAWAGLVLR